MSFGSTEFYLLVLVSVLSGSSLGLLLESIYNLIKGKKELKKRLLWFIIFLLVFILSEYYLFTLIEDTFFRFPKCTGWICPLLDMRYPTGDPMQYLIGYTLLGLFIYSVLQIPFLIYLDLRKKEKSADRTSKRFIIFFVLCILLFFIFKDYLALL
jgi:hypothetical protein